MLHWFENVRRDATRSHNTIHSIPSWVGLDLLSITVSTCGDNNNNTTQKHTLACAPGLLIIIYELQQGHTRRVDQVHTQCREPPGYGSREKKIKMYQLPVVDDEMYPDPAR